MPGFARPKGGILRSVISGKRWKIEEMTYVERRGCPMLVVVALASFVVAGAVAEEQEGVDWITGSQLFDACQRGDNFCLGYIMGATVSFPGHGSSFCLPAGVSGEQVKDVVNIWLGEHRELHDKTASFLVLQAVRERFPCN
jgi:hypothetical protein